DDSPAPDRDHVENYVAECFADAQVFVCDYLGQLLSGAGIGQRIDGLPVGIAVDAVLDDPVDGESNAVTAARVSDEQPRTRGRGIEHDAVAACERSYRLKRNIIEKDVVAFSH